MSVVMMVYKFFRDGCVVMVLVDDVRMVVFVSGLDVGMFCDGKFDGWSSTMLRKIGGRLKLERRKTSVWRCPIEGSLYSHGGGLKSGTMKSLQFLFLRYFLFRNGVPSFHSQMFSLLWRRRHFFNFSFLFNNIINILFL